MFAGTNVDAGPLMLGGFLSWGLFGVLIVQLFIYFSRFDDARWMKVAVVAVALLECAGTGLMTHFVWVFIVYPGPAPVTIQIIPVVSVVIACVVQMFFCWRILVLGKSRVIPALIATLSIIQCVTGAWAGGDPNLSVWRTYTSNTDLSGFHHSASQAVMDRALVTIWLGGGVICDVAITARMLAFLYRARSQMFERSALRFKITRLMTFTLETGLVTAVVAVLQLLTNAIFSSDVSNDTITWTCFLAESKLYANTLLASLNARLILTPPGMEYSRSVALWADKSTRHDVSSGRAEGIPASQWTSPFSMMSESGPKSPRATRGNHIELEITTKLARMEAAEDVPPSPYSFNPKSRSL